MRSLWFLLFALLVSPAYSDLPEGRWRTARPIVLPEMTVPGLVYLPLDEGALAGVDSLSEYRIARAGRVEVPYRMELEDGHTRSQELPVTITSQAVARNAKGVGTRLEIGFDVGSQIGLANQVAFRLRGDNFRCRVLIDGARAADQPGLRLGEGLVYRHEGRFEQTKVAIPRNEFRFLRLTLRGVQGKLPVLEGAAVLSELKVPPEWVPVPAKLMAREDARERTTILDLDPGMVVRDVGLVKFHIEEPLFDRYMSVLVTDLQAVRPAPEDQEVGVVGVSRQEVETSERSAPLRREVAGKPVSLPLSMPRARKLRFTIRNGDDRPLTIREVGLFRMRRGLVFEADPAFEYELWYGRFDAPEPDYDIARLPLTTPPAALPVAQLGEARTLPVKPPQLAWSEKHRGLFWVILAAVLILLAALILRAVRNIRPTTQQGDPG